MSLLSFLFGLLKPIAFLATFVSPLVGLGAILADALGWASLARRTEPPAWTGLFRIWPLVLALAAAALLPELTHRIAAGALAAEHALLLLALRRPRGRVVAGG